MLIAHLSDPHLRPKGQLYQGLIDSNALFDQAIDTLLALDPQPDIVIIGGDLVDEGTAAEYETVQTALSRLPQPVYAIPGNHDAPDAFRLSFHAAPYIASSGPLHFDTGTDWPVRVIGFDVTVPGDHHGDIDDTRLDWLAQRLAEHSDRPTLLLMHQPPIDSGMAYIDAYKCQNGGRLAELLFQHRNIERVLCGHIHRAMQARFGGSLLMTAPSTATAIALRLHPDAEPASVSEPPGLLLHYQQPGQPLLTHWLPIGTFPGPLPFF
ncbi:3',5'-cyclic adenosine monophosphate phosphodiesterase CpdA [Cypionkella aquatica]|uniref:3',5'-cyclic adenosine monophosphate phosphodiesterase CpdA n=1 Tax=Cypionkella aquatica TaxID=1756042 RepID=A0AA37U8G5_9RHOB|nr:phosphodiesterase [Cypionkella aquatica]GLS88660.1 3',5'-cyclic adenosine monophosphate phosphodiesterase CpdA [Cypionkella aquatica]